MSVIVGAETSSLTLVVTLSASLVFSSGTALRKLTTLFFLFLAA